MIEVYTGDYRCPVCLNYCVPVWDGECQWCRDVSHMELDAKYRNGSLTPPVHRGSTEATRLAGKIAEATMDAIARKLKREAKHE